MAQGKEKGGDNNSLSKDICLDVHVVPKSKRNHMEKMHNPDPKEPEIWKVWVTAPPEDGKANKAVCDIIAKHFQVRKSQVTVICGLTSRRKVVKIHS